MKKTDITYILGIVFASATSLFYCIPKWFHIQLPRYYQLEHAWKWAKEPGVPSQAWYASQAFAFVCAGLVTLAVCFALKYTALKEKELKPRSAGWLAVGATLVIIACMVYVLHHEYSEWGIFSLLFSS